MDIPATLIGFFLGFAFGVGCALAVMYSIYMGGYRAAARDAQMAEPPERWKKATESASKGAHNLADINGRVYAVVMESRGIYMSTEPRTVKTYGDGLLSQRGRGIGMQLVPSSDQSTAPTLVDWRQRFDCVDAQ